MGKKYVLVKGSHNGAFVCAAEFCFEPPVCVYAAPKIRDLFIHKGIDKCKSIADSLGFKFTIMGDYYD